MDYERGGHKTNSSDRRVVALNRAIQGGIERSLRPQVDQIRVSERDTRLTTRRWRQTTCLANPLNRRRRLFEDAIQSIDVNRLDQVGDEACIPGPCQILVHAITA